MVTLLLEFKILELVCLYNFGDHGNSHLELFFKKGLLKFLKSSRENISAWFSFLKKNKKND